MLTSNIKFRQFKIRKNNQNADKELKKLLRENNSVIRSLTKSYENNFKIKNLQKYKKFLNHRVIGMGGSTLGTQAIYDFLRFKIKKKFNFLDNLNSSKKKICKKKCLNLIISKSGNTIETIINSNIFIRKNQSNIFITENNQNYIRKIAEKLKADIIDHNDFIGGRYSVLSEVGMLPAELMGLNIKNFKQLNNLVKNKKFLKKLINNVTAQLHFIKNKKYNSIIINYDEKSKNLLNWYQQLVAESLGKKKLVCYQ
tara:strand:+ start:61 stop:825 length:765 start_codon:yes stop_codon:yes gene_type:complete